MAVLNDSITLPMTMTVARVTEKLMIRVAEASLTGISRQEVWSGARIASIRARTKAMKARPLQESPARPVQPRRNDIGGIEGHPDDPAAGNGRTRAEDQHAERREEAAAPRGIDDGRIALDEARGNRAPPDIKGDGRADGEAEQEQDAERGAALELDPGHRPGRSPRARSSRGTA